MGFKGDPWAVLGAAAGVFQKSRQKKEPFSCLPATEEACIWSPFQQNTSMKNEESKKKLVEAFSG